MAVTTEQVESKSDGRGRPAKVPYPGLASGQLEAVPADFDIDEHKPLSKANFSEEKPYLYYDWKAGVLDSKAEALQRRLDDVQADAKEARYFSEHYQEKGEFPVSKRSMAKKAVAGLEALAALRAQLGELGTQLDGVDLDEIAAKVSALGK